MQKSTISHSILSIFTLLALLAGMSGSLGRVTPVKAAALDVNSSEDIVKDDGNCTLREAITSANTDSPSGGEDGECDAGSGLDTIVLGAGTYTLTVETNAEGWYDAYNNWGDLDVTAPLKISGAGAGSTIIKSANFNRLLQVSGAIVTIEDLTLMNGTALDGGAIFNDALSNLTIKYTTFLDNFANNNGGAIINSYGSSVTILNSAFSGSTAGGNGGAIYNYSGTLTLIDSTIAGSTAGANGSGGAIFNSATLVVANSTLSGNTAGANGGAILNNTNAALNLANSTLSGNTANGLYGGGGGIHNAGTLTAASSTLSGNSATYGGGLYNSGALHFTNTLVANSPTGGDCLNQSGTIVTKVNNLVEDGACFAAVSGDPNLGALADNGGPTQTHALLSGSPAVDAGYDTACAAAPIANLDQRGVPRTQGAHCDIGAYELNANAAPAVSSITRADPGATDLDSVDFSVIFSEPVTGVDVSDFILAASGVTGATVSGLTGSAVNLSGLSTAGSAYTVTVTTGSGAGTLRLDVVDDDTILDLELVPLGGAGPGNGSYTGGETYAVRFLRIYLPLVVR